MEERQKNYTIMEGYELPSEGKIYDTEISSHIELRSMTARDEMKRLAPSTTPLKTLADIIEDCIIDRPEIHVYDMCLGDYEYLLHKLRIVTYGSDYKVYTQCQNCGEYFETSVDLNTLKVARYSEVSLVDLQNIVLPVSGKVVKLKFLSPRMVEESESLAKEAKRKFKQASLDFETLYKIILCIKSIDGTSYNTFELEDIILDLPAKDFQKLMSSVGKLSKQIGIDPEIELECPKCGGTTTTFFRFGPEFFRPAEI